MTRVPAYDSPGMSPAKICATLGDDDLERLLPTGAFDLLSTLGQEKLFGPTRGPTLGKLLSVDLALEDPERRRILLSALPPPKAAELEERTGQSLQQLGSQQTLSSRSKRTALGFFGVATAPESRPSLAESVETVTPERPLFPHQKRAAAAVERFLYREGGRVMLHLPTGVGKTRTAMSIISSHLRSQNGALVLWLAGTKELLEQAAEEFEATWRVVGDRSVPCVRFWSHHEPPLDSVVDGILVAGLAKLHSYGRTRPRLWDLGDRVTMLVFDEAHQSVAPTYKDLIETLVTRKPSTPLLGLTATPGRTWNEPELDEAVAELFHRNKVMIDGGGENPIKRLTEEGYLAAVDFSLLNVEPGFQLSAQDLADLAEALDVSSSLAARFGRDKKRNARIIDRVLTLATRHTRILLFAASVDNAILLTSVCRALGVRADVVTAKTPPSERDRIVRRFKRPDSTPRVLVNFGVLTTGFDAPGASAALIARPTKSLVLYSQIVGRVLRGPRAGGTERCEVVTVVDTTLPGFGSIAEAFTNWEDIWSE